VPAYFNDAQRQATKDAGRLAGLEVLRLVNEPTAAALAYGLHEKQRGIVAVYDFGGGTFDISVLKLISTGEGDIYQVLSTSGDTHLGGDDIDHELQRVARAEIVSQFGVDLAKDSAATQELRKILIAAKHELSNADHARVQFPLGEDKLYARVFSRQEFDRWIAPIVARTMGPVKQALSDAHMKPEKVEEIVLVGGSTRIPLVRQVVEEFFGRAPHTELNPDEVVALGAAVQANILETGVSDMLLLDVTPLSLGIETKGGVMTKLIERNTTIPTKKSEVFTTAEDMQPSVQVHVLQGEREMAMYNKTLGKFELVDLPPAPRGIPQIEVTFDIDANGIVHVSARDRATGKEQSMTITGQSSLNKDEIDQMVRDAEAHAADDRRRKEEAEVRNNADSLVYQTEKMLRDQAGEVSGSEKERVEADLKTLKDAIGGSDLDAIKSATERLAVGVQELGKRMYEAASASAAAAGPSGSGGAGADGGYTSAASDNGASDEEVVDAEIVDDGGQA
jgi:molecular chaperone DnaK